MARDDPTDLATPTRARDAALRALAYFDLFHHPLTAEEVFAATDRGDVTLAEIAEALALLAEAGEIFSEDGHYALGPVDGHLVRRKEDEERAALALPEAIAVGQRILALPYVRGVSISGSLSKGVFSEGDDFDFFIVTAPRRLWLARLFIRRLRNRLPKGLLCANYMVDEDALELAARDRFTALEILTMLPVGGREILGRFARANDWAQALWPNWDEPESARSPISDQHLSTLTGVERWVPRPIAAMVDRLVHRFSLSRLQRGSDTGKALASGDIVMSRQVYKGHRESWKHRTLLHIQNQLDQWQERNGSPVDRGLDPNGVLFSHSYFYRFDPKQMAFAKPYPPLGTLYAAAVAREAGYHVSLFDPALAEDESGFAAALEQARPAVVIIYDDGFNYLTKMCLIRMREAALRMIGAARSRGTKVLVCSSDSTDHAELYLDAGAIAVILGEGEQTMAEALDAIRDGGDLGLVPGLKLRQAGHTVATAKRAVLRQLDELPTPAWDLVDLAPYRAIWEDAHGYFSLNISTTRGCPYKCNWCAKPIYGQRYNSRSPERVVAELATLHKQHGARHFWITDDIFGLKPGWLTRFADAVEQHGLDIEFTIQTRVDLLQRDDDLEALARSGLRTAWIGAESGSQAVLDAMDKGITRDQIDAVVPRLQAKGIRTATFLQFGYLGEQREDIRQTIDMVTGLIPDEIGVSVSYPLPGTGFYEKVRQTLGDKANWQDSADLDMMFAGTYSPQFYRYLHRHVHRRHRAAMARARLTGARAMPASGSALREVAALVRGCLWRPLDWIALNWLALYPGGRAAARG